VGEVSLLDPGKATATAKALSSGEVLILDAEDLTARRSRWDHAENEQATSSARWSFEDGHTVFEQGDPADPYRVRAHRPLRYREGLFRLSSMRPPLDRGCPVNASKWSVPTS
jgi:CRP-like cAMP-binding protein